MSELIKSIEDLERLTYMNLGSQMINKADAPVITTTTGVYNAIYGRAVWNQLNQEANAFGALPKVPWTKSGWRIITARAGTAFTMGATTNGGVGEAGTLPDTVKPTFAEVSTKPKTVVHTFESSEVQQAIAAETEDDAFGAMEQMRPIMGAHHKEKINEMLLGDVKAQAQAGGAYTGTNDFETLDRVIASSAESTAFEGGSAHYTIFGLARSATTYDSYVSQNSGTLRVLTDNLFRTTVAGQREQGGNPTFALTGHDTYARLQGLYSPSVRYSPLGYSRVSMSVNGIQTATGLDVGINVATIYNIPVIVSKNVTKETSGISRIYLPDTSDPEGFGIPRLHLSILKPTQYFEAGMLTGTPFAVNKVSTKGMYRTTGEVKCTNLKAQGKIMDLK